MAYIIEHHRAEITKSTRQNPYSEFPRGFDIIHEGITIQLCEDTWVSDLESYNDRAEAEKALSERPSSVWFTSDGRMATVEEYILVEENEDEERNVIDISNMTLEAWVQLEGDEILEKNFYNYPDARAWIDSFDVVVRWGIR